MYLLAFLIGLIILILILILLLSIYPVKIAGTFDSELQPDIHITMSWLNPFLEGVITRHNGQTVITIRLFNKKVLVRNLAIKKVIGFRQAIQNYMDYVDILRTLKINRTKLYASYGFLNPAFTGMLCGVINLISQYIKIDELYNNGDFFTDRNYFNINVEAEIDAAASVIMILRNRIPRRFAHALGRSR